jgi:hypothetical protein
MKQGNLLLSSFVTFIFTGLFLASSAWLPCTKASRATTHRSEGHSHVKAYDFLSTESGRRWRNCQPNHWRGYILQR